MARPWEASFPRSEAFGFSVGLWWETSVGSRTSGGKRREEERGGRCRHFVWLLWRLWRGDLCFLSRPVHLGRVLRGTLPGDLE